MKDCSMSDKKIGQNVKNIRKKNKISQLALSVAIGHKVVDTISMAEIYLNN